MSEQQGDNAQTVLGDIQRIHQLFGEALAECSAEDLAALVRLLAGSLGELRSEQSKEEQQANAQARQQQAQSVQAGDLAALQQFQKQQACGIAEVLSALKVVRQPEQESESE